MKVRYDKEADAAYIQMSSKKPDGAVEMAACGCRLIKLYPLGANP